MQVKWNVILQALKSYSSKVNLVAFSLNSKLIVSDL